MHVWQLQEAKARLSEVVKQAILDGPQEITLRGEPAVIVISIQDFEDLKRPKTSFVDFLRNSPLMGIELDIKRDPSETRDIDL